ncbi:LysM peptidoglycan-binding domain-containing protein [Paenibacillus gorillae]|uniref:LysM peptidoglycan-binding domain-containing protein n=1 Tax=Paenibacillus gorillae TaxID=1243662 RepID=UPI0004BA6EA1|nr:LysM domain-containing protein [Paenibacillus gorillae]
MDRGFNQFGGGFGGGSRPPFRPVPHPFFPRRFLFPFFFFSPFVFPFFPFREGEESEFRNDQYYATHQVRGGETLQHVAHMYNIPSVFLEEANPELSAQAALQPGTNVHVPRISHLHCHKTFFEKEMDEPANTANVGANTAIKPSSPYNGSQY